MKYITVSELAEMSINGECVEPGNVMRISHGLIEVFHRKSQCIDCFPIKTIVEDEGCIGFYKIISDDDFYPGIAVCTKSDPDCERVYIGKISNGKHAIYDGTAHPNGYMMSINENDLVKFEEKKPPTKEDLKPEHLKTWRDMGFISLIYKRGRGWFLIRNGIEACDKYCVQTLILHHYEWEDQENGFCVPLIDTCPKVVSDVENCTITIGGNGGADGSGPIYEGRIEKVDSSQILKELSEFTINCGPVEFISKNGKNEQPNQ